MKDKEIKNNEMTKEKPHWLDDKRNVKRIIYALYFVCAALFMSDFFYHKHVVFSFDSWFGFYAIYGFVMCVGLVIGAKLKYGNNIILPSKLPSRIGLFTFDLIIFI